MGLREELEKLVEDYKTTFTSWAGRSFRDEADNAEMDLLTDIIGDLEKILRENP